MGGLGPPVQPEMEEQPQFKPGFSLPNLSLGGWESMEPPPNEDTRWGSPRFVIHRAEGAWEPGRWGRVQVMTWQQVQQSLALPPKASSGLRAPGSPSGEPGLDAGHVKGVVGVPGRVGNPGHGTPHYGPPGPEGLQSKRIPKINLCGVRGVGERHRETA